MKPPVQSTPFLAGLAWLVSRPWYSWFTRVGQAVDQIGSGTGLSDGDKGDITVSDSGSTWTIDDGAVTLLKVEDIAVSSLLGRGDSGAGHPEVISLGSNLSMSGTTLNVTGTCPRTPTFIADDESVEISANTQMLFCIVPTIDGTLTIDGTYCEVS